MEQPHGLHFFTTIQGLQKQALFVVLFIDDFVLDSMETFYGSQSE